MSTFNAEFLIKVKAIGSIPKRFRSAFEIKLIFDLTAKHVDVSRSAKLEGLRKSSSEAFMGGL